MAAVATKRKTVARTITLKMVQRRGACYDGQEWFKATFGKSAKATVRNIAKVLDAGWWSWPRFFLSRAKANIYWTRVYAWENANQQTAYRNPRLYNERLNAFESRLLASLLRTKA